jgi:hypothetical protein
MSAKHTEVTLSHLRINTLMRMSAWHMMIVSGVSVWVHHLVKPAITSSYTTETIFLVAADDVKRDVRGVFAKFA